MHCNSVVRMLRAIEVHVCALHYSMYYYKQTAVSLHSYYATVGVSVLVSVGQDSVVTD
jgi:hypothetical protein